MLQKDILSLGQEKRESLQKQAKAEQENCKTCKEKLHFYDSYFKQTIRDSEITKGRQLHNEFEIFAYTRFTLTRLFLVDPGLGKRVIEKPIGFKKKELLEVIGFAVSHMNEKRLPGTKHYTTDDFLEGIYRTEPSIGTHYELYFKDLDAHGSKMYKRLVMTRPYGPLHLLVNDSLHTRKGLINLILPLSGRTDTFQHFMNRFVKVCIKEDKKISLTVVYFGKDGLQTVKKLLAKVSKEQNFTHIKLLTLNEKFSRGRGLQAGAQSWTGGDVIMFLCDVDIVFSVDFLERCRLNAQKGKRVYYPIVFSLYNPKVVYSLQDLPIPPEREQLVVSKDTGFWRDFGFGMTCQYRSDFMKVGGFDEQIVGWGMEDTLLYRKYVKSDLMVVRATDPGIFHLWHEKVCDPKLPYDQHKGCIRSKALNEASHPQLGMLAFKEEIAANRKARSS